jgi:hypothetical protein
MASWFKDFGRWVLAVLGKWYGWLPSSAIAAGVGYGQAMSVWHAGPRVYGTILGLGFIVSLFEAWRIQYRKAGSREPFFRFEIAGSTQKLDGQNTIVLLVMRIVNTGAPSAVVGWRTCYKAYDQQGDAQTVFFPKELKFQIGNTIQVFKSSDAINFRTNDPIPTGGFVAGRLPIIIPGDRTKEILRGDCEITVTIFDYLNKPYIATYKGGKETKQAEYLTGEPISAGQVGENLDTNSQKRTKSPAIYQPGKKKKR